MNETALRDIHLPELPSWWPPAPGWWLMLVLLILLVVGFRYLRQWLKYKPCKTLSLLELQQLQQQYNAELDQKKLLGELSILLRRSLMSYQGRTASASLTGQQWIQQLNQLTSQPCFTAEQEALLAAGQYQRDSDYDVEALLQACENWINALPRSQSYVPA